MSALKTTSPADECHGMSLPCCPDCSPYCQDAGLALGQARGGGQDWWGEPFDDGFNSQAGVFWGDECCPDCAVCAICQGRT